MRLGLQGSSWYHQVLQLLGPLFNNRLQQWGFGWQRKAFSPCWLAPAFPHNSLYASVHRGELDVQPYPANIYVWTQQNAKCECLTELFWWPLGTCSRLPGRDPGWELDSMAQHSASCLFTDKAPLFPLPLTFSEISFINSFQYLHSPELFVQPFTLRGGYLHSAVFIQDKLVNPPPLIPVSFFPYESYDDVQR